MLTWPEDDSVPEHDVVWTWASRDATWRITRKAFKIANEASSAVGRLIQPVHSVI
jgi:hypothetical protein